MQLFGVKAGALQTERGEGGEAPGEAGGLFLMVLCWFYWFFNGFLMVKKKKNGFCFVFFPFVVV